LDDYHARLTAWAASIYSDPVIAKAATDAALRSIEAGTLSRSAETQAHRAAVAAGGEYRCQPDRVGKAVLVCVLFGVLFIPATLFSLSVNPSLGGYLSLCVFAGAPALGVIGLAMVRRNSCFFATTKTAGRRNWLGQVAARASRAQLMYASFEAGSWARVYRSWNREFEGPDDSTMAIVGRRADLPRVSLYWWTDARIKQFVDVLGLPTR
jgi:hypothetical protein